MVWQAAPVTFSVWLAAVSYCTELSDEIEEEIDVNEAEYGRVVTTYESRHAPINSEALDEADRLLDEAGLG